MYDHLKSQRNLGYAEHHGEDLEHGARPFKYGVCKQHRQPVHCEYEQYNSRHYQFGFVAVLCQCRKNNDGGNAVGSDDRRERQRTIRKTQIGRRVIGTRPGKPRALLQDRLQGNQE